RIRPIRGRSGRSRSTTSSDGPGCATGHWTRSASFLPRPTRTSPRPPPEPGDDAVNPILALVAVAVIGGAVVVVAARDARTVSVALALTLVASPLLADPLASPLGLAARLVGAILATYLLWMVVRQNRTLGTLPSPTSGSR